MPWLNPLAPADPARPPVGRADITPHVWSPALPADHTAIAAPYALLPELGPQGRPVILPSLAAMARRIHRLRGGDGLQLRPTRISFRDQPREVTEVLAVEEASGRARRLGFAWHAGRPWQALQAALEAECPTHAVEG